MRCGRTLKPVLARQMEIYAGFMEQTDHHIGRLVDALEDLGILDDTLIYLIIGDNGASAEGTINGCFNEMTTLNGMPGIETTEFLLSKIDDFGTPKAGCRLISARRIRTTSSSPRSVSIWRWRDSDDHDAAVLAAGRHRPLT